MSLLLKTDIDLQANLKIKNKKVNQNPYIVSRK